MDMLRRGRIGLLVLMAAGWASLPAKADGGPYPGPPPPYLERPSIWQGLYVGAHLGWGSSGDLDGIVGGGQVGYNWQANQIVYGLEADASFADISGGNTIAFGGMFASASASVDWLATVRGRVGLLLNPRLLAYTTAGVGIARASWEARAGGFGFGITTSGSDTSTGFVFGVGVEGKISETLSARVEYLTGFDNDISNDGVGIVRAGLNWKLGQ
jgi:outer membrane immunogenic protein